MTIAINVFGMIGMWPNRAEAIAAQLQEIGAKDVTININSFGGIASEGTAIFNVLQDHPGRITTVNMGAALSAAATVFMAGRERVMRLGALLMIHDPSTFVEGDARDMHHAGTVLNLIGEQHAEIYSRTSGKPLRDCRELMLATSWFAGKEAVAAGFATRTEQQAAAPPPAFNYGRFPNAPAELIHNSKDTTMSTQNHNPAGSAAPVTMSAPAGAAAGGAPASGEPTMTAKDIHMDIVSRCKAAHLSADQTLNVVGQAFGDVEAAKNLIINMMADRDPQPNITSAGGSMAHGDRTLDNPSFAAKAVQDALYARMSGKPVDGAAASLLGHSITDLGRIVLQANGRRDVSGPAAQIAEAMMTGVGMHTTDDFPALLGGAANRFLLDAYQAAESDAMRLARTRNVNRLDDVKVLRLSEMPTLDENPEAAEIRHGTRGEEMITAYRTKTYAKLFALSRRAIINDDLNGFIDTLSEFGRAAARTKAEVFFEMLKANNGNGPVLDDGKAVFHASRGNLLAASGLDIESLDEARTAIRTTKGLDGKTPLNLRAKYILVGPELETRAEAILSDISATKLDDVNPHSKKLELLVDARIEGDEWMVFADQRQAPVLEVAYLNGQSAPQLSTRDGWSVLGQEYRAVLDFGCGFIGWRGAVRNPGVGG